MTLKASTFFFLWSLILLSAPRAVAQNDFKLQGKWTVDFASTLEHMAGTEKERYEKMPTHSKENMTRAFADRTYEFAADGSLTVAYNAKSGPKSYLGNWIFNGTENKLTMIIENSSNEYTVVQTGENKIGLIYRNAPAQGLLKSLYLNRKN